MEWVYDNQQKEKEIFNVIWNGSLFLKASALAYNRLSEKEGIMENTKISLKIGICLYMKIWLL